MRTPLILISILALWLLAPLARAQDDMELPLPPPERFFTLAQAYPCFGDPYPPGLGITGPACFAAQPNPDALGPGAVPGVLCLARRGRELDVNCFVTPPPGARGPCTVQSSVLIKSVPGRASIIQVGKQIRTWWSLNFTPPGTTFTLIVTSVCPGPEPRQRLVKRDVFAWRVEAYPETMLWLIELMHTGAVGALEIPCILAEDTYDLLRELVLRLDLAVTFLGAPPTPGELLELQKAVIDLEQFLLLSCLSVDVASPLSLFPGPPQHGEAGYQPPGNLVSHVFTSEEAPFAGILDTIEHPCCSILLADLDYIAARAGLPLFLSLRRLGGFQPGP